MQDNHKGTDAWVEPTDPVKARADADYLLNEVHDIELQLASRAAENESVRLPNNEWADYRKWRASALMAKEIKMRRYRRLKDWLKQNGGKPIPKTLSELDLNNPKYIIECLIIHIKSLHKEYTLPYTETEQELIDGASYYLRQKIR